MRLIDTHAHLDFPKLSEDIEATLLAAREAGVERIVTIGASRGLESNYRALAIARAHANIRCTAGIHPHDASMATDEIVAIIEDEFAGLDEVVAIGEAGLDYHYDYAPKDVQQAVFRRFLQMAKRHDKPIIIHSREAEEDTIRLLHEEQVRGGILHCFTGSQKLAEQALELDFYISFSGIVTFNSGAELLAIAASVPADRILVETDSPYLAPIPFRGRTNQPAYVRHTAEKIATARGVELEVFAEQVWENAARVFGWP
ncbi:MAG: TatD family hydrolase [Bradymonadaceae bacterium]|nr:TatD family hydrolase [Lujinxingiaceae bacterium]